MEKEYEPSAKTTNLIKHIIASILLEGKNPQTIHPIEQQRLSCRVTTEYYKIIAAIQQDIVMVDEE